MQFVYTSNILIEITTQPVSVVTIALEDSSLNCSASVNDVTYSWHRVGGSVPLRSIGENAHTLIIPRATPHDNGEYYCIIKKGNISVESNKAVVTVLVNGEAIITMCIIVNTEYKLYRFTSCYNVVPNNLESIAL